MIVATVYLCRDSSVEGGAMALGLSRRRRRLLEERVRSSLRPLSLPSPLTMVDLCARLGEHRGRPIELKPQEFLVPGPSGMWIAAQDVDIIAYQARTTEAHQRLIIMHEIGHIIAGHTNGRAEPNTERLAEADPSPEFMESMFPDLPPELVRSALRRESYDEEEEHEAEAAGTIVLNWSARIDHIAPPSADTELGQRVQDNLGNHLGWQ